MGNPIYGIRRFERVANNLIVCEVDKDSQPYARLEARLGEGNSWRFTGGEKEEVLFPADVSAEKLFRDYAQRFVEVQKSRRK